MLGGVQGDGGEVSVGAAVGRGSFPGMEAAGPENSSSDGSKEEETIPRRPVLRRNPGGKLQTTSLTSAGSPSMQSKCPHAPLAGWDARSKGCAEHGSHLPTSLFAQKKKSGGAGAAEQPVQLRSVMEWLLRCCRLASRVDRSIDKTVFTSSFAELLSWCRTWSCMGMSQLRPWRFAEVVDWGKKKERLQDAAGLGLSPGLRWVRG